MKLSDNSYYTGDGRTLITFPDNAGQEVVTHLDYCYEGNAGFFVVHVYPPCIAYPFGKKTFAHNCRYVDQPGKYHRKIAEHYGLTL